MDTRGYIDLYTIFGEEKHMSRTIKIIYLIVEVNTSYNILLERPSLNHLGIIISMPHLAMMFPSIFGDIITVHVDQKVVKEC